MGPLQVLVRSRPPRRLAFLPLKTPQETEAFFLPALAVEGLGRERRDVDAFKAAYVDRDGRVAGLVRAAAKGLYSARLAEDVRDFLRVEAVLREVLFAGEERELRCWHEGQDEAFRLAVAAVAGNRLLQVRIHAEADGLAVARSFVCLLSHRCRDCSIALPQVP